MDFSAPFVESLVNLISSFELLFKFGIDSSITFISLNTVVPLSFSNKKKENIININPDFLEWFRGFTDAEGSFIVASKGKVGGYLIRFAIRLHKDDLMVLKVIQETLQIGKVYNLSTGALFQVSSKTEISKIIDIFSKAPINSNKQLNFIAFKEATPSG